MVQVMKFYNYRASALRMRQFLEQILVKQPENTYRVLSKFRVSGRGYKMTGGDSADAALCSYSE